MPKPTKGPRLGGSSSHQKALLANLATSLFEHGRIKTTEPKARALRPYAEKLITHAKQGTLHNRREVLKKIRDKDVVHKLFAEIGPNYAERAGGYTRIVKLGPRKGDNAPMASIELVEALTTAQSAVREGERARGTKSAPRKAARGRTAEIAEEAKDESPTAASVAADAVSQVVISGDDATDEPLEPEAVEESASTEEAPYGDGSHAPLDDGGQPDGFPIKGNEDSKFYYAPGSEAYDDAAAEVWFATADDAEAAGFSVPPAQEESADEDSNA